MSRFVNLYKELRTLQVHNLYSIVVYIDAIEGVFTQYSLTSPL